MKIFEELGAEFILPSEQFPEKLKYIKAFIFDWDGVFNAGVKGYNQTSLYSEVDAMGINMLRFAYYLLYQELPLTVIITGENNHSAFQLAKREHFDAVYYHFSHKTEALAHLHKKHTIDNEQIAFIFDDILDISLASQVALRFLIKRKSNPLFLNYTKNNHLCDYITANESGQNAVREITELILGQLGVYEKTISKRIAYTQEYQDYLERRKLIQTDFFTKQESTILQTDI
ncbi:MAG: phosphatase [Thermonemataceae bacterium]|nr:phosphatase [Thermonemataceae bacterium]